MRYFKIISVRGNEDTSSPETLGEFYNKKISTRDEAQEALEHLNESWDTDWGHKPTYEIVEQ